MNIFRKVYQCQYILKHERITLDITAKKACFSQKVLLICQQNRPNIVDNVKSILFSSIVFSGNTSQP